MRKPPACSAPPDDPIVLIAAAAVRRDLGVLDDVTASIDRQVEEFSSTFLLLAASRMPREEADRELAEANQKAARNVKQLLTGAQAERLRQIGWQLRGASALADREMADMLQLSEAQRARLQAATAELGDREPATRRAGLDQAASAESVAPAVRQFFEQYPNWLEQDLLEILSAAQLEQLRQALGAPSPAVRQGGDGIS